MRTVLVFLMVVLLTNAVPGQGVLREGGPAPATTAYCVSQGATSYSVGPVENSQDVVTYYDYYSASAHTPFVEPYVSILFLYRDTTSGKTYLVFHFNIDNAGTPDAQTSVSIVGIPAGATVAVSDDPGEFQLSRSTQGQFHYFDNTDGGALGPLPTSGTWQMNLTVTHFGADPMRSQKWVDADGTRLSLAMSGVIRVTNACNQAPTASAGGPYAGFEGSPFTFNAGGSSDPDGDALTYTWDFQNDGVDDLTTTDATVQHTYPDDFAGKAKLTVSDGSLADSATVDVSIANVAPTITLDSVAPAVEGGDVVVQVRITDPGTDTVVVTFDPGDTSPPYVVGTLWSPSDVPLAVMRTYGDDGAFPLQITAGDEDGGNTTLSGIAATVDNAPPVLVSAVYPGEVDEGSSFSFATSVRDPGSDDLVLAVEFGNGVRASATRYNDGVGPDPDPSPFGTFPFVVSETFSTAYGQNGVYSGLLTATDDDGGVLTVPFSVRVRNVAPTILPFGPASADEGTAGTLAATATDPGDDALTFAWTFELGTGFSETLPATGSPTTQTSTANFLYGDDGSYAVRLTVTDQDGASATYETTVEVRNVAPAVAITQVQRPAAFVLRVAGEKWHDVRATFFANDTEIGALAVVRMPGSPDDQAAATGDLELSLAFRYAARVLYTPEDDPVNGQPNGANPVWVILRTDDGQEVWIHHTFNVEHPGTYAWGVDLTPYVAQLALRFSASATDPGSDDLAFAWDFGDGSPAAGGTHFNDGVSADLPKSPGGTFPFTAPEKVSHAFAAAGTYTITLTVTDDDGGVGTATVTITILG